MQTQDERTYVNVESNARPMSNGKAGLSPIRCGLVVLALALTAVVSAVVMHAHDSKMVASDSSSTEGSMRMAKVGGKKSKAESESCTFYYFSSDFRVFNTTFIPSAATNTWNAGIEMDDAPIKDQAGNVIGYVQWFIQFATKLPNGVELWPQYATFTFIPPNKVVANSITTNTVGILGNGGLFPPGTLHIAGGVGSGDFYGEIGDISITVTGTKREVTISGISC
eukprot:gb/GEZN01013919.1/.p1 GENE.gb/GEZN01013919.1/~~gb/GEZN01013919.1/.p1  ORF type:complete len:224 (-),score=18.68 gb/GEZN01013919.1/:269-940(-)